MFKEHRSLRVPTDGKNHGEEQYAKICKKKFSQLKNFAVRESKRMVGEQMKEWLATPEAASIRERLGVLQSRAHQCPPEEERSLKG